MSELSDEDKALIEKQKRLFEEKGRKHLYSLDAAMIAVRDRLRPKDLPSIPPKDTGDKSSSIFEGRKLEGPRWLQRRYFIAFGKSVSVAWVDDDNTCTNQHLDGAGIWHQYQDKEGQVYALRCPDCLPPEIVARLERDEPPGHAYNRLREARANRKASVASIESRVKQEDYE